MTNRWGFSSSGSFRAIGFHRLAFWLDQQVRRFFLFDKENNKMVYIVQNLLIIDYIYYLLVFSVDFRYEIDLDIRIGMHHLFS